MHLRFKATIETAAAVSLLDVNCAGFPEACDWARSEAKRRGIVRGEELSSPDTFIVRTDLTTVTITPA